jgi:hypothetical protein
MKKSKLNQTVFFDTYAQSPIPLALKGRLIGLNKKEKIDNYNHTKIYNSMDEVEHDELYYLFFDCIINHIYTLEDYAKRNPDTNN